MSDSPGLILHSSFSHEGRKCVPIGTPAARREEKSFSSAVGIQKKFGPVQQHILAISLSDIHSRRESRGMEIGPEKEGKGWGGGPAGAPPSQLEIERAETTPQLHSPVVVSHGTFAKVTL